MSKELFENPIESMFSGKAWKHHLTKQVKEWYEGAGKGATIFLDYDFMVKYLKEDGREWSVAELELKDTPIRYDFLSKGMVTILCDAASGPFIPIDL